LNNLKISKADIITELEFAAQQKRLFSLYEKGNIEEILSFVQHLERDFPEKTENTSYWKASLYLTLHNSGEAIDTLSNALNKGLWWNPQLLSNDPSFRSLQENKEFKNIINECQKIYDDKKIKTKSHLSYYGKNNSNIGIFALHWGGSNVKEFAPFWCDEDILNNYFMGFPQSSQLYSHNAFDWRNREIAIKDITTEFNKFKKKFHSNKLILAGASQGGALAIELSLQQNIKNNGFIAIAPEISDISSVNKILSEQNNISIKGCIIISDNNPFFNNAYELVQVLKNHGVQCKLISNKEKGPFFPENFPTLLPELVDYINQTLPIN